MDNWDSALRDLSDDPSEFTRVGAEAMFMRHGDEYVLHFMNVPSLGLCVDQVNDEKRSETPIPLGRFIQEELLGLPRLAKQIQRVLDVTRKGRPSAYVDGPARVEVGQNKIAWDGARAKLEHWLAESEPGSTRLIQLMATAGQGKTVLLEEVAAGAAQRYRAEANPSPLILLVDLLGRYVGSIDDAIAGSLNNTYLSPGMSQKDVVFCMRHQWLTLALDGFDELAARIGPRDAFLRISDLVDQLETAGTILLSARESFFELHRIAASIRTYLQPKIGTYAVSTIVLEPWSRKQGIEVFRYSGSNEPGKDLESLLTMFEKDENLVLQPFFLTRLVQLWSEGKRFEEARGVPKGLGRFQYVISAFVAREASKWKDRDGNQILSTDQHIELLASITEEMWRSGAFRLTKEELEVAAEVCIGPWKLTREREQEVLRRVPTHGLFSSRDQRVSFLHDRFLDYFVAVRIRRALIEADASLGPILSARLVTHEVIDWVVWMVQEGRQEAERLVKQILAVRNGRRDDVLEENISFLCARLISGRAATSELVLPKLTFYGEAFQTGRYSDITFRSCSFWQVDLRKVEFKNCRFEGCQFGDILIDAGTNFGNSVIAVDSSVLSVELEGQGSAFAPSDIESRLKRVNATFEKPSSEISRKPGLKIDNRLAFLVERYVRASERTTDVAIEDMEQQFGDQAEMIAKLGVRTEILKKVSKQTSGPRKNFVRFRVDKDRLLRAQVSESGDAQIDEFWKELAKRSKSGGA